MVNLATFWKYAAWGIGGAVTVVVVTRTVYYSLPEAPPEAPPAAVEVAPPQPVPVPTGNPLLSATREQFRLWMPPYCGADLFHAKPGEISQGRLNACVRNTITKVKAATGVQLASNDVTSPAVKAHWKSVVVGG